jgi:predicted nucleic acid-binding protein
MPRPTVVLDANILFPAPLRDFFMHLGIADAARICWSARIEDEWTRNVIAKRPDLEPSRVYRTAKRMNEAMPNAFISGFENIEAGLELPDPDDRHVLAAAIQAGADVIITKNLRDFPNQVLAQYDIQVMHPDTFVHGLLQLEPQAAILAIQNLQASLKNPPKSMLEVLTTLEEQGMTLTVKWFREFFSA